MAMKLVVFSILLPDLICCARKFPPGFRFGSATSSYQVEGAWNVSDKTASIWDTFSHSNPSKVTGHATGDIACDSYFRWKDDINVAAELGLHFYRFSIAWPRLLPTGFVDKISEDGKNYYNALIDGLLERGIEPVVTLYHWELPQRIQNLGGFANAYVVDWFADYARVAFTLFGDRVKTWITINEPLLACDVAYNTGNIAPGIRDPEFANYLCAKHMLLAHAKAWRIYDEEFRHMYHGKIGLTNQLIWFEEDSPEDADIAERVRQYVAGIYSHPIYTKTGGWPPELEQIIAENSKRQGYARSRLPPFTQEEIDLIKGTYDFYGLNYYTSRIVRKAKDDDVFGNWPLGNGAVELGAVMSVRPEWKRGASSWFWSNAPGLRQKLKWLKKNYGDMEIFITENGFSTFSSRLDDEDRVQYFKSHLEQVWLAITEDGVNVTGYTAWSMIDNFEWVDGYDVKFGLYYVDMKDESRTRVPRASAKYYANVIRTHSLDVASKYNSQLYSTVLFYAPLPIVLVVIFLLIFSCPKYAKIFTTTHHRLLNTPDMF
ncbi:myrosinase 1-like [Battus philenor]|uniref:myrosinase 1-like n=1 Tax=Battus philenor TaxID=42288 RepID=UPI0035D0CD4D